MVMRQCGEGGEKWCRYRNSFKDRNKGNWLSQNSRVRSGITPRDIHGCPVSNSKALWIRVHSGYKARTVTALHHYSNNTLFHGETLKGINTLLSMNTPTFMPRKPN